MYDEYLIEVCINQENYLKSKYKQVLSLAKEFYKKEEVDFFDLLNLKNDIIKLFWIDCLSPKQITEKYNLSKVGSIATAMKLLGIRSRTFKEAALNFAKNQGNIITDEKRLYWKNCLFKFDPFLEPKIIGYELLKQYKFITGWQNQTDTSLHRDHMMSINTGWQNNIDSKIISHPANCQIMFYKDNCKKNGSSSISLETLKDRIEKWDYNIFKSLSIEKNNVLSLTRTEIHKQRISATVSNQKIYTNGIKNIKQDKFLSCPIGYWAGMTRNKNKKI